MEPEYHFTNKIRLFRGMTRIFNMPYMFLGILLLCSLSSNLWAASTTVTNVSASREGKTLIVRIDMTNKINPHIVVAAPTAEYQRLVVDVPHADKASSIPQLKNYELDPIKRIRLGQHPDKLRIVVDLQLNYDFTVKPYLFNNALVLELKPVKASSGDQ